MSEGLWKGKRSLLDALFEEPWRFDFFQAVRLLEMMDPGANPPAERADQSREAVKFRSRPGLGFPASDIQDLKKPPELGTPAEMLVNFLGLAGFHGPLPIPVTEMIIERTAGKDMAFADFIDIFNHRLISLMIRVRKAHYISLTAREPHQTPAAEFLFSCLGLGLEPLRNRMQTGDRSLLLYSGILSRQPRSAVGLERMLGDYFDVAANLQQFVGEWRELEPGQQTAIGTTGKNQTLGRGAVLGNRLWNQYGRVRIVIGPLRLQRFMDFLPGGLAHRPVWDLARFYLGQEIEFDLRFIIIAAEVPECRLGAAKLGWTSWLKTKPLLHDAPVAMNPRQAFKT